ncbi:DUF6984 family protein [Paraburkholderia sp.]|uniref:DUF6984 family protein n=1 Tax=Paraburkholderia sp. TaxID=1926495 RepID=UPI002D6F3F77|nr:hypothetical protein [Paraburkholderia sp.]HZZ04843.1 hypothetical protein [Paraburkholderia sp.]
MDRKLTDEEKSFIREVAARLDPEDEARLTHDLANAHAEPMLDDNSLILFHIDGYQRPQERGQHTYPYEGTLKDADGAVVDVLLLADAADRLFQLEFLRWGDGPLKKPDWTTLKIVHISDRGKL